MNIASRKQASQWRLLLFCVLLQALTACAIESMPSGACQTLLPGDLVLTEVMANPKGADGNAEWLEFYNATIQTALLTGLSIEVSRSDGSSAKTFRFSQGELQPGEYLLLGAPATAAVSDVTYISHGGELGQMLNSGGIISLRCGNTLIDQAFYSESLDGVARALDGSVRPDALLNDRPDRWCDATISYAPQQFGTPGAANGPCGDLYLVPEFCQDASGPTRRLQRPSEGDLVISEIMANPAAVDDTAGEWIEVAVLADVDLNGLTLQVGNKLKTVVESSGTCQPATANSYLLLARKIDPAENGGLPQASVIASFSLPNTGGSLALLVGEIVIDHVSYGKAQAGQAWALEQSQVDTRANDLSQHWCLATTAYGAGDKGSPGALNPACPLPPITYDGTWCYNHGTWRRKLRPTSGDLLITEFLSDPLATADEDGEWLEILATKSVDLNGLKIARTSGKSQVAFALDTTECLRLEAGQLALLAASSDPAVNGGLPPITAKLGISLVNDNRDISLHYGEQLIDQISYGTTQAGVARVLDAGYQNASANDDPALWCNAKDSYGDGDKGTPGLTNPSCGAVPTGYCYSDAATRPIQTPVVGDLWITEIMADPKVKSDSDAEWFEIYAQNTVDLIGLTISRSGTSENKIETTACTQIQAGSYAIFAHTDDPTLNGQLPTPIALFTLSLPNSGQNTNLSLNAGAVTLDSVVYTVFGAGKASQLTSLANSASDNDQASAWCAATQSYGDGDKGTPKAANALCP